MTGPVGQAADKLEFQWPQLKGLGRSVAERYLAPGNWTSGQVYMTDICLTPQADGGVLGASGASRATLTSAHLTPSSRARVRLSVFCQRMRTKASLAIRKQGAVNSACARTAGMVTDSRRMSGSTRRVLKWFISIPSRSEAGPGMHAG